MIVAQVEQAISLYQDIRHETRDHWHQAFESQWMGSADEELYRALHDKYGDLFQYGEGSEETEERGQPRPKFYGRIVPIIQSSMTGDMLHCVRGRAFLCSTLALLSYRPGKSRMTHELGKYVVTVPICLREPSAVDGYPEAIQRYAICCDRLLRLGHLPTAHCTDRQRPF